MGKWTKESHGFSMLRQVADRLLVDPQKKSRVWSDKYAAWGFYDKNVTEEDEFLFWSAMNVGDRVRISSVLHNFDPDETVVVVGLDRDDETAKRHVKVMRNDGRTIVMAIEEGRLFKLGWRSIT